MKTLFLGMLVAALAVTMVPTDAAAKRLGGGKSTGMQRDMPARTAPDAPPAKPATPQGAATPAPAGAQQAAPAAATAGATAAAAAPAKRSWLGPIAGLAAGLGIAALLSHLGLGEGVATFLMLALLAIAAFFVIRLVMRRFAPQPAPAAASGMARTGSPTQVAWPSSPAASSAPSVPAAPAATAEPSVSSAPDSSPLAPESTAAPAETVQAPQPRARAFVPAAFDSEGFQRVAKMIFVRLQAANDARDLDDLRAFTTPEMFAELRLDIAERGPGAQTTEVVRIEAEVLDVAQEAQRQIVSVRYRGEVREQAGAAPVAVDEVWHLVKPLDDSRGWAIAGIEQMA